MPKPWQPWQGELIAAYFATSLDSDIYLAKIERAALIDQAGIQVAHALMPDPPDIPSMFDSSGHLHSPDQFQSDQTNTNPSQTAEIAGLGGSSRNLGATLQDAFNLQVNTWADALLGGDRASNDWAVDGTLTATGKPILANDPHLQLTTPSLLYLAQITISGSSGFTFEGLTIPGFPAFISGHNTTIAYGATFVNMDDTDLYAETLRQTSAGEQVEFQNHWVAVQTRQETFQIAGAPSVT